jgi:hypothetical protein
VNNYLVLVYGICFSLIAGGAFALMWGNIQSINKLMDKPTPKKHPEAPEPGEEVMYVDFSKYKENEE